MSSEDIKKQLEEFKESLPIDSQNLDGECLSQADLYQRIGTFVMDLKQEARVKKNHLEFIIAKIKTDIRANPGNYVVAKLSVDAVDEACRINSEVIAAIQDHSDAQYIADCGIILKEAVEQRKSLIRDAVSLYTHEYYMSDKMNSERKAIGVVTEDQVLKHRRQLANQRESSQEEVHGEE